MEAFALLPLITATIPGGLFFFLSHLYLFPSDGH